MSVVPDRVGMDCSHVRILDHVEFLIITQVEFGHCNMDFIKENVVRERINAD